MTVDKVKLIVEDVEETGDSEHPYVHKLVSKAGSLYQGLPVKLDFYHTAAIPVASEIELFLPIDENRPVRGTES